MLIKKQLMCRSMKVGELAKVLESKVLCGDTQLDKEIDYAFSSDLMSDLLTIEKESVILLTGLSNIQTIRAAEMQMIDAIVIARGKTPTDEMIRLAEENNMVLMQYNGTLFSASGLLYNAGLRSVY